MSSSATMELAAGARILSNDGYLVVEALGRHSAQVTDSNGGRRDLPYSDIAGTRVQAGRAEHRVGALEPWWSGLSASVRRDALDRMEAVLEIATGYRWGHKRLAQAGEPFPPFGDESVSIAQRCARMADQLSFERGTSRTVLRRVNDGEIAGSAVTSRTVQNWVRNWQRDGLRGLVDKRATKGKQGFDALDERIRRIVDEVFERFDGDVSRVNTTTIEAEVRLQMKVEGIEETRAPERLLQEYLSHRQETLGRTTRSHRSRRIQTKASGHSSYPAMSCVLQSGVRLAGERVAVDAATATA